MKSASNLITSPIKDLYPGNKLSSNQQQAQQLYQQSFYHCTNIQGSNTFGPSVRKKTSNNNTDQELQNSINKRNQSGTGKSQNNSQNISQKIDQYKNDLNSIQGLQYKIQGQEKHINQGKPTDQIQMQYNSNQSKSQNSVNRKKLAGIVSDEVNLPTLSTNQASQQAGSRSANLFIARASQPISSGQYNSNKPLINKNNFQDVVKQSLNFQINQRKINYLVNYSFKPPNNLSANKNSPQKSVQNQTHSHAEQSNQKLISQTFSPINHKNDESRIEYDSELLPIENLPHIESSKISSKNIGYIQAYAANTHQGLVRNYNEDRVSIILNMMKPACKPNDLIWPQCSYFAIYDGHGGSLCAEFLRDSLHYFIIRDDYFPSNPRLAIKRGYEKAEKAYLELADQGRTLERSGSCAVAALIIDQICYIANVGDSRAILSSDKGLKTISITQDHKPNNKEEEDRIKKHGGQIYQSQIPIQNGNKKIEHITGPFRVLPGRLAVSRTFGDAEAKLPKYNGIPNVISAEPDIFSFKINEENDFLILACDGIFDKMTTKDVISTAWDSKLNGQIKTLHEFSGRAIENIMITAFQRKTLDNITVVLIAFQSMEKNLSLAKK